MLILKVTISAAFLVWCAKVLQTAWTWFRKLGKQREGRKCPKTVSLTEYSLQISKTPFKINLLAEILEPKKTMDYSAQNLSIWTSGSNLQKNSGHALFWYDTYEYLSKEITADLPLNGLSGIKCVLAFMWVLSVFNCRQMPLTWDFNLAGQIATKWSGSARSAATVICSFVKSQSSVTTKHAKVTRRIRKWFKTLGGFRIALKLNVSSADLQLWV